MDDYTIILASNSPRRKQLLESCGLTFEVMAANVDENICETLPPEQYVRRISERKCTAAVRAYTPARTQSAAIVAADTIVCVDDTILGKPRDEADALRMLKRLQGGRHSVYTGLCVAFVQFAQCLEIQYVQDCCCTQVVFNPLSDSEICNYIDACKPLDKAGAYGIQDDWDLVKEIHGDYNNVMGLPVDNLMKILRRIDV